MKRLCASTIAVLAMVALPISAATAAESSPALDRPTQANVLFGGIAQPAAGATSTTTITTDWYNPGVINTWKSWDNKTKVLGTYLNISNYKGKSVYVKSVKQCFTGVKGERILSRPVLTSETDRSYVKDFRPAQTIASGQCYTWPVKKTFYGQKNRAILVSTAKMYEKGPISVVAGFYLK